MTCGTPVNTLWTRMYRPIYIQPIGDSLTLGTGSTDGTGFRSLLEAWFRTNPTGSVWDVPYFLGPSADQTVFNRSFHWGVSGADIDDVTAGAAVNIGRSSQNAGAKIAPDIFLIMIGLNDARDNPGPYAGALTRYATMLSTIDALYPGKEYVVTTISDVNPAQTSTVTNTADFNAGVAAVWAASGLNIHSWDAFGSVPWGPAGASYFDQFHWNDTGYALAATAMQVALESALCASRQNA